METEHETRSQNGDIVGEQSGGKATGGMQFGQAGLHVFKIVIRAASVKRNSQPPPGRNMSSRESI